MSYDTYKYNSSIVAMYIVANANKRRLVINMTKLQKLLYIMYGTYLAVTGERLTNEHPQAWPYGPVFPSTRNYLLKMDLYQITEKDPLLEEISRDLEMKSLANIVLDTYGNRNASTLSEWSHQPGSPWDRTVNHPYFHWGDTIPDSYINDYFNSIIVRRHGAKEPV